MSDFNLPIDTTSSILKNPGCSHNRWHPDIPPALRIAPGDRVTMDTRDAFDGQIPPETTPQDLRSLSLNRVHPLTGPIWVEGAMPGDLLAVTVEEVIPTQTGVTLMAPGFGFLRDEFTDPYLVHWELSEGFARSRQLPGLQIRGAPFMGVMGVAPSHELMANILARERDLSARGGMVFMPEPSEAIPPDAEVPGGLRTLAPHENGGNIDIKQLVAGTTLFLPVWTPGALFSAGDAHFAQGDGEVCGTAVEIAAKFVARFDILRGEARRRGQRDPTFECSATAVEPRTDSRSRFYVTTGMCVHRNGRNESEDVTLAARNALLNMIDYISDRYALSRAQAYCVASVTVDLRISQVVDVPNVIVSAFLPLDVFESGR